jgi:arylsulfatase A-like enzyme
MITLGCSSEPGSQVTAGVGGEPLSESETAKAIELLTRPAEPVPLPASTVRNLTPDVHRLTEHFQQAQLESEWTLPDEDPLLVSIGPISSATIHPTVKLQTQQHRGIRLRGIEVGGFSVPAQEVGQILIRAEFEESDYFILRWPGFGGVEIRIAEGGGVQEYSISTDGLAKWQGSIEKISLLVPVPEGTDTATFRIELLGMVNRRASFHRSADALRVRIGRVVRDAIYLHGSTRLSFPDLSPVAGSRLSLGAAILAGPLRLKATLEGDFGTVELIDTEIDANDTWTDLNVAIPKEVTAPFRLILEALGASGEILFVSNPTIYKPERSPPRVIFYLIDTLGANHTSLYGYSRPTSPHLEKLASEGTWFENAFANAAYTPESVPSMMTSMHVRSHGVTKVFQQLSPEFLTVQEAFSAAGYATVAFSTNGNAGPARGTDIGFDSFYDHLEFDSPTEALRTVPINQVISWMMEHQDRPVFVYIHTAEPHSPYAPPPPFNSLFDPEYNGSLGRSPLPQGLAITREFNYEPRELEHLVALYDGEVAFADQMLETFQLLLQERGLLEKALFLVTADHGEEFMEHNRLGHGGDVVSQLLRVPLILWGSDYVASGSKITHNVQLLDVMPTLLEIFGIEVDAPLQGDSLVPLMAGDGRRSAAFEDRPIFAATHMSEPPKFSLTRESWKLNVYPRQSQLSLFDLASDPGEQVNLARRYPGTVRRMLRSLLELHGQLPAYEGQGATRHEISQEQIDRLRALGYLQ